MGTVYACWTLLANTPPAVADSARRPTNHRGSAPVWLSPTWKETLAHMPSSSFLLRRCSEWFEQTMQMTLTFKFLHMMQVVLLKQLAASGVFSVRGSNQILHSRRSRNTNTVQVWLTAIVQHFGECVFKCFLSNEKSDEKIDTNSGLLNMKLQPVIIVQLTDWKQLGGDFQPELINNLNVKSCILNL